MTRPPKRRKLWAGLVCLALGLTLPLAPAGPAAAVPVAADSADEPDLSKVEPAVLDQLAEHGTATFWVRLAAVENLAAAPAAGTQAEKAAYVFHAKRAHADATQAGLRALLDEAGATYTRFWIANTVQVTGDSALVGAIAGRSDVAAVEADRTYDLPEPVPGSTEPRVNAVEWNIDRVGAPRVWQELGVRGESVVVANIDSGADHTHPALAGAYRGRQSDGTLDHNYNWFDPTEVCSTPAPCDNNGHGTHTMGTMVGADGDNQIGVAPGARWIAAKGCGTSSCARADLLAAGQWIVAPTDLSGQNPRPDLAPDVVNNSWGNNPPSFDPWYQETVRAWMTAGIFPAISNGNGGPACGTSSSPGTYVASYSSGAFDINNAIASFSSRGPGEAGEIKPNIAAPGVNVRSSVPGGYASNSGTSMASPHTAATVALMWSASPAIRGNIEETRRLLDGSAVDVDNTTCGGAAADNNVWGEGRLDAFAAVSATPRGGLGDLTGVVTSGGAPLAGATVSVTGPLARTTVSGADGRYQLTRLLVGSYTVTVSKFGFLSATGAADITEGGTTVHDADLVAAPAGTISGTVRTSEGPASGARITVVGTPVSSTADAEGRYALTVPHGAYELLAEPVTQRCAGAQRQQVTVTGDMTVDLTLPDRLDGFGHACGRPVAGYTPGTTLTTLTGDNTRLEVVLPFPVPLYGRTYRRANIVSNGVLAFGGFSTTTINTAIPTTGSPNGALYPLWDNLVLDAESGVYTGVVGTRPHRTFLVEWRNVTFSADRTARVSFVAMISEDGTITFRYRGVSAAAVAAGSGATIGIEDHSGTVALQYSFNEQVVSEDFGITFRPTGHGVVYGDVSDANDRLPVAGATATVRDGDGDTVVNTDTTGEDGAYLVQVPVGSYAAAVEMTSYESATAPVVVDRAGAAAAFHASLRTGKVVAAPAGMDIVTPADQQRRRVVTLANQGGLSTGFTVTEAGADGVPAEVPWLAVEPDSGILPAGATTAVRIVVDATGLAPGSFYRATLVIRSDSGRAPVFTVPITLVVPAYRVALDCGSTQPRLDSLGDTWASDQAYTAGNQAGWLANTSRVVRTNRPVTGTDDPARYTDAREGMYEYRFSGLAAGVYTVELNFAELVRATGPDQRVFDVLIEGVEVLPSMDIALEAGGSLRAVDRVYTVLVTDGTLNVRFITHTRFGRPLVNAIRVTHRPDRA